MHYYKHRHRLNNAGDNAEILRELESCLGGRRGIRVRYVEYHLVFFVLKPKSRHHLISPNYADH
jgi:hypothetical protein